MLLDGTDIVSNSLVIFSNTTNSIVRLYMIKLLDEDIALSLLILVTSLTGDNCNFLIIYWFIMKFVSEPLLSKTLHC